MWKLLLGIRSEINRNPAQAVNAALSAPRAERRCSGWHPLHGTLRRAALVHAGCGEAARFRRVAPARG